MSEKKETKKQNNRNLDEKTYPDPDNKSIANEKEWDPKKGYAQPETENKDKPSNAKKK